jgi:carbamoyltransferase
LEDRHKAIASSLQQLIEEILIRMARSLYEETPVPNICLAGGVSLNCVANAKILEETPFKNIFVQPAAGDAGGALGAAMAVYCSLLDKKRVYVMEDPYLGPEFSSAQIKRAIGNSGLRSTEYSEKDLYAYVARKIAQDTVVGWFQGRMEFGPRALGNRSILGNPCSNRIKGLINDKVKHREPFRPFAPVVLQEKAAEYFDLTVPSPFMLLAPAVKKEMQARIPAVTHCDGTARVQTVTKSSNGRLYRLIQAFEEISGVPVLLNTSFNLRGEPIVCSPEDAIQSFLRSQMDCLVLCNSIVER